MGDNTNAAIQSVRPSRWKRLVRWIKNLYEIQVVVPASQFPSTETVELVEGKYRVHIYNHILDTPGQKTSCRTYISDGLRRHGQVEIGFSLADPDAHPAAHEEVLRLYSKLYRDVGEGRLVQFGDVTPFENEKFLGHHLAYGYAAPMPGVPVPPLSLCIILITDNDLAAILEFGFTRVMSRLAQASRQFPHPIFSDLSRPGLSFDDLRERSILSSMQRIHAPGAFVYQENNRVVLLLQRGTGAMLHRELTKVPKGRPVVLLTEFDFEADAWFVWGQGKDAPTLITAEKDVVRRIGGAFFCVNIDEEMMGACLMEDGYATAMPREGWDRFLAAIATEQAFDVPGDTRYRSVSLQWEGVKSGSSKPDIYEFIGIYSNMDARRLLDAFSAAGIEFTLNPARMGLHDLSPAQAAYGGTFGNCGGIAIGVHVGDMPKAMLIWEQVLKIST